MSWAECCHSRKQTQGTGYSFTAQRLCGTWPFATRVSAPNHPGTTEKVWQNTVVWDWPNVSRGLQEMSVFRLRRKKLCNVNNVTKKPNLICFFVNVSDKRHGFCTTISMDVTTLPVPDKHVVLTFVFVVSEWTAMGRLTSQGGVQQEIVQFLVEMILLNVFVSCVPSVHQEYLVRNVCIMAALHAPQLTRVWN